MGSWRGLHLGTTRYCARCREQSLRKRTGEHLTVHAEAAAAASPQKKPKLNRMLKNLADHTFAGPKDSAPAVAVLQPTKEENPLFKPQTKVAKSTPAVNVLQASRRQRPLPPASVPQTIRICTFNVWRDAPYDRLDPSLSSDEFKPGQQLRGRAAALTGFFLAYADTVDIFALQECTAVIGQLLMAELEPRGFKMVDATAGNEEQIVYRASRLALCNSSAHRLPQSATAGDSNMVTVA